MKSHCEICGADHPGGGIVLGGTPKDIALKVLAFDDLLAACEAVINKLGCADFGEYQFDLCKDCTIKDRCNYDDDMGINYHQLTAAIAKAKGTEGN